MGNRYTAVAIQPGHNFGNAMNRQEMKKHLDYFCEMIDMAVDQYCLHGSDMGVKLIVGSECGLYGYQSGSLREMHDKYAVEIPGEETQRLTEKAKEYNLYICPGSIIEKPETETLKHLVFNTMPLIGPEGLLTRYRKVQPMWAHEPTVSPHDLLSAGYDTKKNPLFPIAKTEIGNLGCMICFDAWFPEIGRQYALNGCEVLLGATAWYDPVGRPPWDIWQLSGRARSVENMCYGVWSACGFDIGKMPSYPTSGGSFICDYRGFIQTKVDGPTETMTCSIIDLDALRAYRKSARVWNTLAMLRTEAYDYLNKKCWTPHPEFKDQEELDTNDSTNITADEIDRFYSEYYGEKCECPRWRPPQYKTH